MILRRIDIPEKVCAKRDVSVPNLETPHAFGNADRDFTRSDPEVLCAVNAIACAALLLGREAGVRRRVCCGRNPSDSLALYTSLYNNRASCPARFRVNLYRPVHSARDALALDERGLIVGAHRSDVTAVF